MANGSSDSCDIFLRNECYLSECPLLPEGGCNVIIVSRLHDCKWTERSMLYVSWVFFVTVLHLADKQQCNSVFFILSIVST